MTPEAIEVIRSMSRCEITPEEAKQRAQELNDQDLIHVLEAGLTPTAMEKLKEKRDSQ